MAANLYAKSIFGEDALANLSIEKPSGPDSSVTGHIRIRAKSQVAKHYNYYLVFVFLLMLTDLLMFAIVFFFQGMALSLGDKINVSQKKAKNTF